MKAARSTSKGVGRNPFHVAGTRPEFALFEFQHAAICFIEAFYRHIGRQLVVVTGDPNLSAQDCVVLIAVRIGERPKSVADIMHFSNRGDVANVQYSIRKLVKARLVQKAKGRAGRGTSYELTVLGRRTTDSYVETRSRLIERFLADQPNFVAAAEGATRLMMTLTGVYDHFTRSDAVHAAEPAA